MGKLMTSRIWPGQKLDFDFDFLFYLFIYFYFFRLGKKKKGGGMEGDLRKLLAKTGALIPIDKNQKRKER